MSSLRGITWSHPRGFEPLEKLAQLASVPGPLFVDAPPIVWSRQDLAGFESTSIAQLAEQFDLIVLDHPGLGAAIAHDALEPLDGVAGLTTRELDGRFVAGSLEAYNYRGTQYAIPIDAATQVSAWANEEPAIDWTAVLSRQSARWAIPTKSPHTVLSLLGIAAAVEPAFTTSPEELIPAKTAHVAFDIMGRFIRRMPPQFLKLDPIEILELIANRDLDASPLLYGYVTYARPSERGRLVAFADAPAGSGGVPGSILGGTGVALSRHSENKAGALEHIRQISGAVAQRQVVGQAGGQPADAHVWANPVDDGESGEFYSATLRSQTRAMVRPRYDGWIDFQHRASALLLECALADSDVTMTIASLNSLHRDAMNSSRVVTL